MKNQYMFFAQQGFENFDLSDYSKSDTTIPKTSVHIYSFECIESDKCSDDKSKAKLRTNKDRCFKRSEPC